MFKKIWCLLATFFFISTMQLSLASNEFRLLQSSGLVEISSDKKLWKSIEAPFDIPSGTWLKTSPGATATLVLPDQTQTKIAQNSTLNLSVSKKKSKKKLNLKLLLGKIWSKTNKQPVDLSVDVPKATASIRGTQWIISVNGDQESSLLVLKGKINVTNSFGEKQEIKFGDNARIQSSGRVNVSRIVNPKKAVQFIYRYKIELSAYEPDRFEYAPKWVRKVKLMAENDRFDSILNFKPPDRSQKLWLNWFYLISAETALYLGDLTLAEFFLSRNSNVSGGRFVRSKLYLSSGQLDEAISELKILPNSKKHRAYWLKTLGDAYLAKGQYAESRSFFYEATKLYPKWIEPLTNLAIISMAEGMFDESRYYLNEAIKSKTNDPDLLNVLADFHTLRNEFSSALNVLSRLSANDNTSSPSPLIGRGLLSLKSGDPSRAKSYFVDTTAIDPNFSRIYTFMAVSHLHLGEPDLALARLNDAIELDPNDPLPHVVSSQIYAARFMFAEALHEANLVTTKSSNGRTYGQLSNDQNGGANIGRRYYEVGLPKHAKYFASLLNDQRWAATHLFKASTSDIDFERNSRYLLGYSLDSQSFGSRRDFPDVISRPGQYGYIAIETRFDDRYHGVDGEYLATGINGRQISGSAEFSYLADIGVSRSQWDSPSNPDGDNRGILKYKDSTGLIGLGRRASFDSNSFLLFSANPFRSEDLKLKQNIDDSRLDIAHSFRKDHAIQLYHLGWQFSNGKKIQRNIANKSTEFFEWTANPSCEKLVQTNSRGIELGIGEISRIARIGKINWSAEYTKTSLDHKELVENKQVRYCYDDDSLGVFLLRDETEEDVMMRDLLLSAKLKRKTNAGVFDIGARVYDFNRKFSDSRLNQTGYSAIEVPSDDDDADDPPEIEKNMNSLSGKYNKTSLQYGIGYRKQLKNNSEIRIAHMKERHPLTKSSLSVNDYGGISPQYGWMNPGSEIVQNSGRFIGSLRPEIRFFAEIDRYSVVNNPMYVRYFSEQESSQQIKKLALNRYQSPLHYALVYPSSNFDKATFARKSFTIERAFSSNFSVSTGIETWRFSKVDDEDKNKLAAELPKQIQHLGASLGLGTGILSGRIINKDIEGSSSNLTQYIQYNLAVKQLGDFSVGGSSSESDRRPYIYANFTGYF